MQTWVAPTERTRQWVRWIVMGLSATGGIFILVGVIEGLVSALWQGRFGVGLVVITLMMLGFCVVPACIVVWSLFNRRPAAAIGTLALLTGFFVLGGLGHLQRSTGLEPLLWMRGSEPATQGWLLAFSLVMVGLQLYLTRLSYRLVWFLGKRYLETPPPEVKPGVSDPSSANACP